MTRGGPESPEQRVNHALAIAVRKSLDGYSDEPGNRDALARSIGKRLRGTYGFDLRRTADMNPELTAEDLFAHVIVPHEFPWDAEAVQEAAAVRSGDRDKARVQRYGPYLDPEAPDLTPPEEIPERIADLRASLKRPGPPLAR